MLAASPRPTTHLGRLLVSSVLMAAGLALLVWLLRPDWLPQQVVYDFIANRYVTERLVDPDLFKADRWDILGQERDVLFVHPTAAGSTALVYPVKIEAGSTLAADLAVAPEAWTAEGDGVTFTLYVEDRAGIHLVYSRYVDPKHHQQDRTWLPMRVNLSAYAGQVVRIILVTGSGPAGDLRYDWAGWGRPRLERPVWSWPFSLVVRSADLAASPVSLDMDSSIWQAGAPVTLTLHTHPPQAGVPISLTLAAPGPGHPQADGLSAEFFGLSGVQILWLPGDDRITEMQLAAGSGATIINLAFEWTRLEPKPGQYDWAGADQAVELAKRYGLQLAPMLLYTPQWASSEPFAPLDHHIAPPANFDDYRNFVYNVVERYKPYGQSALTSDGYGIRAWIIWNEPNVQPAGRPPQPGEFWTGSLADYIRLQQAGYEGAHAADPGCTVLNAGLADVWWAEGQADLITALERLYDPNGDGDAGDGGRPFFDTLNIHLYQFSSPTCDWYQARLAAVTTVMARFGDANKPIWITETGYGTASGASGTSYDQGASYVDEPTQAQAVSMIYTTLATYPQVERVFWWSLRDYHSNPAASNPAMEAHFGLLRAGFAPKPAYLAYGRLTGRLGAALELTGLTDQAGGGQLHVPATFVSQPGRYIVFASWGTGDLMVVKHYEARPQ